MTKYERVNGDCMKMNIDRLNKASAVEDKMAKEPMKVNRKNRRFLLAATKKALQKLEKNDG